MARSETPEPDGGSPMPHGDDSRKTKQPRELTPAARRALAEAEERRRKMDETRRTKPATKEIGGRDGPDPIRYGDWEKDGLTSDF